MIQPLMGRLPSAAGILAARTMPGAGWSVDDAEPRRVLEGCHDGRDGTVTALMDKIVAGMWRTGSYTQLDPGAIPDTTPAAPKVSTSALHLARKQGKKTSWQ